MIKKFLALALALAMALTLFACGNGGDTNSNSSENPGGTGGDKPYSGVKLSLQVDTDMTPDGVEAVIKAAEEKLGLSIDIEYRVGGSDGDNLVKTRLSSGTMTDILGYNSGAKMSALNPSQYFYDISGNSTIMDRLDDTYLSSVTVGGATYGVPVCATQAGAVLYNKPLYEKYNLSVPKTWDEFMANCKTLQDAGEVAMLGSFGTSWTTQVSFLGDNANIMAAKPNFAEALTAGEATYTNTPEGLASFQKCLDMHPFYNTDYLATSYDDAADMLVNGEGAHWIILTQALANIYNLYGDQVNDIGVFAIPGDSDAYLTVWMPTSWYINKDCSNIEAAEAFLEFYTSEEALDIYTQEILPDGPYCIKGYELPDNAYEAVAKDMQAYFDAGKTGLALEFITDIKGANCEQITQEIGSGQTTAEEAAAKYDADCRLQAQQLGYDWAQ